MKQVNLAGLLYGAEVGRKCCASVNVDWKNYNGTPNGFRELMYEPTKRRLQSIGSGRSDDVINEIIDESYIMTQWLRFKKVYDFHPAFVDYLEETENGKISISLLSKLPFKTFYISFGNRPFSTLPFDDGTLHSCWSKGLIVDVVIDGKYVYFSIQLLYLDDLAQENNGKEWMINTQTLTMEDGETFEQAFDYTTLPLEEQERFFKDYSVQDLDAARSFILPFYRIALNACNYLCAANAEIRDVKIAKKNRQKAENGNRKHGLAIQTSQVGYRIGQRFEKMYKDQGDISMSKDGYKGNKKRPHVRRAHWHHYWTGTGRTNLEVRWLEPVFVMGLEEEIDTVIHEVEGGQNAI